VLASLGYQLTLGFAGGLTPHIMVSSLAWTGTSLSVAIYVFAVAVVTFVSV
jgi:hypothetical protein